MNFARALMRAGIYAKDLKRFEYLGRHDKVGMAVGAQLFDAGESGTGAAGCQSRAGEAVACRERTRAACFRPAAGIGLSAVGTKGFLK